jgi:DNA-binding transcriptional MerR regulator
MRTSLAPISEAARATGASEALLRSLDRRGLVKPQKDTRGCRLYGPSDLDAVRAYLAQSNRAPHAA